MEKMITRYATVFEGRSIAAGVYTASDTAVLTTGPYTLTITGFTAWMWLYDTVTFQGIQAEGFARTGLTFCGLMMGDHSKCGINTMFNTGTVVGVSVNIFGSGVPRNFVPSFSWGGKSGFTTFYRLLTFISEYIPVISYKPVVKVFYHLS